MVISVDPSEGSQVAPESTVTLVISKGSKDAEEIAIRDVIGLDEETAKSILSDFNIIVKTGTSSKVAEGEVMEVDPAIGTKVKKGSDVTIYVNSRVHSQRRRMRIHRPRHRQSRAQIPLRMLPGPAARP